MQASSPSSRPLWHQLEPGAYGCGFKSLWQLDYGRTYNRVFDDKTQYAQGKAPRPILINLWYPTNRKVSRTPMVYGDYLHIHSEHEQITRFSSELAAHARAVLVKDVFHKAEERLTLPEQEAFQALLDTDTAVYRDAPAAKGRFPCILYMAGAGSSFESNSVLCEFLASRGYVVIGSAFQEVDGTSLNLEGTIRALGDIQFLLAFAHDLPSVDWNHIGMVGHSLGAQMAILYQTEPGCAVDATVSLDTTQDYYNLSLSFWKYMTEPVKESITNMTRPILFAANANAGFEMADTMTSTPRYLLTIDGLFHDAFVTHGSLDRWAKLRLASSTEQEAADTEANLIWDRYGTLCQTVLNFLDATLKGHSAPLNAQLAQDHQQEFRGDQPYLAYVPPGADGPSPYSVSSSSTPSPRQVRQLLRTKGVKAAVTALREGWRPEPWSAHSTQRWRYPAYDGAVAFSLLYELMAQGQVDDAKILYQCYNDIGRQAGWPKAYVIVNFLLAEQMLESGTSLEYLLALEPDYEETVGELKIWVQP